MYYNNVYYFVIMMHAVDIDIYKTFECYVLKVNFYQ